MLNFEEQRILQVVQQDSLSEEEKIERFNQLFAQLIETGIGQVSKSIAGVRMSDGTVVDNPEYIREFLDNCERDVWEGLKSTLDVINNENIYNTVNITCSNEDCKKPFVTPFVFEQTNFFG